MPRTVIILFLFLAACGLTRPLADGDLSLTDSPVLIEQKSNYLHQRAEKRKDAPDIIWIIVDDLGMADTDLYGQGTVHTPNLN